MALVMGFLVPVRVVRMMSKEDFDRIAALEQENKLMKDNYKYGLSNAARFRALEQEVEKLKDFILKSVCPQSWEEGSRVTYPNCGKCVYCEITQALHKEGNL